MSKRGFGKYFSLAAVAAVAAVAVKYLKDYTDFKEAAQPDLYNLKDSSISAKDAAKRTYVSIKSGSGVKEAAGDLAKAAGRMAKDAGSVAMVAGKTTVDTVKDIKAKYDEDPEAAKEEVLGNFKDMKPEYKKDYVTVLKKYFGLEWLAPFDNMVSPGKLITIEKYIEDAIEAAGLDKDDIAKRNKQEIKSVAIACSQVLRDIEVLNDWRAFERFLRNGRAVLTWKGVSKDDMEAVVSEILRAVRVYLWKDQPDNAYTYYR